MASPDDSFGIPISMDQVRDAYSGGISMDQVRQAYGRPVIPDDQAAAVSSEHGALVRAGAGLSQRAGDLAGGFVQTAGLLPQGWLTVSAIAGQVVQSLADGGTVVEGYQKGMELSAPGRARLDEATDATAEYVRSTISADSVEMKYDDIERALGLNPEFGFDPMYTLGAIAEQSPSILVDALGAIGMPAHYFAAMTGEFSEEAATRDGRDQINPADVARGSAAALVSVVLDRIGLGAKVPGLSAVEAHIAELSAGGIGRRALAGFLREAPTEAIEEAFQEVATGAGASVDPATGYSTGLAAGAGALFGGPGGAAVGAAFGPRAINPEQVQDQPKPDADQAAAVAASGPLVKKKPVKAQPAAAPAPAAAPVPTQGIPVETPGAPADITASPTVEPTQGIPTGPAPGIQHLAPVSAEEAAASVTPGVTAQPIAEEDRVDPDAPQVVLQGEGERTLVAPVSEPQDESALPSNPAQLEAEARAVALGRSASTEDAAVQLMQSFAPGGKPLADPNLGPSAKARPLNKAGREQGEVQWAGAFNAKASVADFISNTADLLLLDAARKGPEGEPEAYNAKAFTQPVKDLAAGLRGLRQDTRDLEAAVKSGDIAQIEQAIKKAREIAPADAAPLFQKLLADVKAAAQVADPSSREGEAKELSDTAARLFQARAGFLRFAADETTVGADPAPHVGTLMDAVSLAKAAGMDTTGLEEALAGTDPIMLARELKAANAAIAKVLKDPEGRSLLQTRPVTYRRSGEDTRSTREKERDQFAEEARIDAQRRPITPGPMPKMVGGEPSNYKENENSPESDLKLRTTEVIASELAGDNTVFGGAQKARIAADRAFKASTVVAGEQRREALVEKVKRAREREEARAARAANGPTTVKLPPTPEEAKALRIAEAKARLESVRKSAGEAQQTLIRAGEAEAEAEADLKSQQAKLAALEARSVKRIGWKLRRQAAQRVEDAEVRLKAVRKEIEEAQTAVDGAADTEALAQAALVAARGSDLSKQDAAIDKAKAKVAEARTVVEAARATEDMAQSGLDTLLPKAYRQFDGPVGVFAEFSAFEQDIAYAEGVAKAKGASEAVNRDVAILRAREHEFLMSAVPKAEAEVASAGEALEEFKASVDKATAVKPSGTKAAKPKTATAAIDAFTSKIDSGSGRPAIEVPTPKGWFSNTPKTTRIVTARAFINGAPVVVVQTSLTGNKRGVVTKTTTDAATQLLAGVHAQHAAVLTQMKKVSAEYAGDAALAKEALRSEAARAESVKAHEARRAAAQKTLEDAKVDTGKAAAELVKAEVALRKAEAAKAAQITKLADAKVKDPEVPAPRTRTLDDPAPLERVERDHGTAAMQQAKRMFTHIEILAAEGSLPGVTEEDTEHLKDVAYTVNLHANAHHLSRGVWVAGVDLNGNPANVRIKGGQLIHTLEQGEDGSYTVIAPKPLYQEGKRKIYAVTDVSQGAVGRGFMVVHDPSRPYGTQVIHFSLTANERVGDPAAERHLLQETRIFLGKLPPSLLAQYKETPWSLAAYLKDPERAQGGKGSGTPGYNNGERMLGSVRKTLPNVASTPIDDGPIDDGPGEEDPIEVEPVEDDPFIKALLEGIQNAPVDEIERAEDQEIAASLVEQLRMAEAEVARAELVQDELLEAIGAATLETADATEMRVVSPVGWFETAPAYRGWVHKDWPGREPDDAPMVSMDSPEGLASTYEAFGPKALESLHPAPMGTTIALRERLTAAVHEEMASQRQGIENLRRLIEEKAKKYKVPYERVGGGRMPGDPVKLKHIPTEITDVAKLHEEAAAGPVIADQSAPVDLFAAERRARLARDAEVDAAAHVERVRRARAAGDTTDPVFKPVSPSGVARRRLSTLSDSWVGTDGKSYSLTPAQRDGIEDAIALYLRRLEVLDDLPAPTVVDGVEVPPPVPLSFGAFLNSDGTGTGKSMQVAYIAAIISDIETERAKEFDRPRRPVLVLVPAAAGNKKGSPLESARQNVANIRTADGKSYAEYLKDNTSTRRFHFTVHTELGEPAFQKSAVPFAAMLLDEAHVAKSADSEKAWAKGMLNTNADFRAFFTATPVDMPGQEIWFMQFMVKARTDEIIMSPKENGEALRGNAVLKRAMKLAPSLHDIIAWRKQMADRLSDLAANGYVASRSIPRKTVAALEMIPDRPEYAPDAATAAYFVDKHSSGLSHTERFMNERAKVPYMVAKAIEEMGKNRKVVVVFEFSGQQTVDGVRYDPAAVEFTSALRKAVGNARVSAFFGEKAEASVWKNWQTGNDADVIVITDRKAGTGYSFDDDGLNQGPQRLPRSLLIGGVSPEGTQFWQVIGRTDRQGTMYVPMMYLIGADNSTDAALRTLWDTKVANQEWATGWGKAQKTARDKGTKPTASPVPGGALRAANNIAISPMDTDIGVRGLLEASHASGVEGGARAILQHVAENSTDEAMRAVALSLEEALGGRDVTVRRGTADDFVGLPGSLAFYDRGADSIVVGMDNAGGESKLVLHEIVHAVTAWAIDNDPAMRERLAHIIRSARRDDILGPTVRTLEETYTGRRRTFSVPISLMHEFVAAVLPNPRILREMREVKVLGMKNSPAKRFWLWLKDVVGLRAAPETTTNAFDELMDLPLMMQRAPNQEGQLLYKTGSGLSDSNLGLNLFRATLATMTRANITDTFARYADRVTAKGGNILRDMFALEEQVAARAHKLDARYKAEILDPFRAYAQGAGRRHMKAKFTLGGKAEDLTELQYLTDLMELSGIGRLHFGKPLAKPRRKSQKDHNHYPRTAAEGKAIWELHKPQFDALSPAAKTLYNNMGAFFEQAADRKAVLAAASWLDEFFPEATSWHDRTGVEVRAKLKSLKGASAAQLKALGLSKAWLERLDNIMKPGRVPGWYAPMRRFGDHVVVARKDIDYTKGDDAARDALLRANPGALDNADEGRIELRTMSRFETVGEARAFAEGLRKELGDTADVEGPLLANSVVNGDTRGIDGRLLQGFAQRVDQRVSDGEMEASEAHTQKLLFAEAMLDLVPDTSSLQSLRTRKRVAGATPDMMRSLSHYGSGASHVEASLQFNKRKRELSAEFKGHASTIGKQTNSLKPELRLESEKTARKLQLIRAEFIKREAILARGLSLPEWGQQLSDVGFLWYLVGASYNIVNAAQGIMYGLPIMGSRHGMAASSAALANAYKVTGGAPVMKLLKTGGTLSKLGPLLALRGTRSDFDPENYTVFKDVLAGVTDPNHKRLLEYMGDMNDIDMSQTMDLARTGTRTHIDQYGKAVPQSKWGYLTEWMKMAPHTVEVMNRSAVAIAAFDLEYTRQRKQKVPEEQAFERARDYSRKIVRDTQFNYAPWNKARVMMGTGPRMLLMFKQHVMNTYFLMARNMALSFDKTVGTEERAEARKAIAYFVAMHLLATGLIGGVPEPVKWLIQLTNWILGGDPLDWEVEMRQLAASMVGPEYDRIIAQGLPALAGMDLSSRIGLNSMLMYDTPSLKNRETAAASVLQTAGGPLAGLFFRGVDALAALKLRDWDRVGEALAPKAVRDVMEASRIRSEGFTTLKGTPFAPPEALSAWDYTQMYLGFSPSAETELRAARTVGRQFASQQESRSALFSRFALAEGRSSKAAALEAIASWNREHRDVPGLLITRSALLRSMQERRRNAQQNILGIQVPKGSRAALVQELDFARSQ